MKKAKTLMIQGTGSGVGKSIIVTALCRIFKQEGLRTAPFKAQNMALNSFVTAEGREIGRAQATQAFACGIEPCADINPVLIKPTSDRKAQIIVNGKPVKTMSVYEYTKYKKLAYPKVKSAFKRLSSKHDIIVIEGAGSPAEINLKKHDLVNMRIARLAESPVILVGDIDRGGVFAWLSGTLQLLTPEERRMVKGLLINKFRGDKRLLMPGIRFIERHTGIKVIGVIPHFPSKGPGSIKIPEEDSQVLELKAIGKSNSKKINIAVISVPQMSNFSDFDALEQENDVCLNYVKDPGQIINPDVIILPGSKNTIGDLLYLRKSGLAEKILSVYKSRPQSYLIGICGGYQMLGEFIHDNAGIESRHKKIPGLGILPVITHLGRRKTLSQVKAKCLRSDKEIAGYEIHHGRTKISRSVNAMFRIHESGSKKTERTDGVITPDKRSWGTYIHGVFDNDSFRRELLNKIRVSKGYLPLNSSTPYNPDKEIDKLSALVRNNIDMKLLYKIIYGYSLTNKTMPQQAKSKIITKFQDTITKK